MNQYTKRELKEQQDELVALIAFHLEISKGEATLWYTSPKSFLNDNTPESYIIADKYEYIRRRLDAYFEGIR